MTSRRQPKPAGPLPFVSMNMAMTADGKIATANRAVGSFGSKLDHARLYELRAFADAVMCGAGTVNAQDVEMNSGDAVHRRIRRRRGLAEENLRVVVTGSARLNPSARLFHSAGGRIILLTSRHAPESRVSVLRQLGVEVHRSGETGVDLARALSWLRREHRVARLHCEGGGELNAALFGAGLVDELHLTVCPVLFGGRLSPTIAEGAPAVSLGDAFAMNLVSARQSGSELFLTYRRI